MTKTLLDASSLGLVMVPARGLSWVPVGYWDDGGWRYTVHHGLEPVYWRDPVSPTVDIYVCMTRRRTPRGWARP